MECFVLSGFYTAEYELYIISIVTEASDRNAQGQDSVLISSRSFNFSAISITSSPHIIQEETLETHRPSYSSR